MWKKRASIRSDLLLVCEVSFTSVDLTTLERCYRDQSYLHRDFSQLCEISWLNMRWHLTRWKGVDTNTCDHSSLIELLGTFVSDFRFPSCKELKSGAKVFVQSALRFLLVSQSDANTLSLQPFVGWALTNRGSACGFFPALGTRFIFCSAFWLG